MSFQTLSAILRGRWLIDRQYVEANLPLIVNMLTGKQADFFQRSGNTRVEQPFIVDPETFQRYDFTLWDATQRQYVSNPNIPNKSVAVIPISGPILKYNAECGEPGSIQRISWIQQADTNDKIVGNLYLFDTPGGQFSGTSSLASAIRNTKKKSVGLVDDGIAASAGMWLASSCDEVYASLPTDQVGSIGVYTTLVDFSDFFEQQGITIHDIYAPQSSAKNLDYREALDGNYSLVEEDLKVLAQTFITAVDKNRKGKATASIKEWSSGKMFYAKDAVKIGLIDGILDQQAAVKRVLTVNRGNKLITSPSKQNSNMSKNNNLSFTKTLIAAKADAFEVVEGGFLTTEEALNNIESHISDMETEATSASTRIAELEGTVRQQGADLTSSKQKITELQAEISQLKKSDSGTFTQVTGEKDDDFGDKGADPYSDLRKAAFPGRYK